MSLFYRQLATPNDLGSSCLFATEEKLELLKQTTHIYFDATFKAAPALYYQLFTAFVPYADTAFPVFYALQPRKTQSAYRAIYQKLIPEFAPASAMADFKDLSASNSYPPLSNSNTHCHSTKFQSGIFDSG